MRPPIGSPGFGPRPGPYPSNSFPGARPGFPGPRHPSSQAGTVPPQSPSSSAPVPSHLAGPPRPMVPPQRPHVSLGQEPQHEQVRVKTGEFYGVSFCISKKAGHFCRVFLKCFHQKLSDIAIKKFELSSRVKKYIFFIGDIIHQLNFKASCRS